MISPVLPSLSGLLSAAKFLKTTCKLSEWGGRGWEEDDEDMFFSHPHAALAERLKPESGSLNPPAKPGSPASEKKERRGVVWVWI